MADVDVNDVGEPVVIHVPDMLHDHGAAERTAAVAHHVFEDAEFLGGELDILAAAAHLAADAVEREVAHLQPFRSGLAAAQQSAHPRQQLDEGKRLHQIVVGAAFEALYPIVNRIARAQDAYRRAHLAVANLLQHLQTVHVRQHQIENDEIVLGAVDQLDGRRAVAGNVHRVSCAFQPAREKILNAFLVLDDENSHTLTSPV